MLGLGFLGLGFRVWGWRALGLIRISFGLRLLDVKCFRVPSKVPSPKPQP